ncbi:MAG: hypothetical protein JWN56_1155 [Sphingobacteriales bacterium]|nr:hypothetical protein [Sphingobacteriales bacterium]
MQGKHLFEYAVIRLVPRVEREEFFNVGVILYCSKQRFLKAVYQVNLEKLNALCLDADCDELTKNLQAFINICDGTNGGPIGQLDKASRFRWLTATRSTVVQCSKVHPGFCDDAAETLNKLYNKLVL